LAKLLLADSQFQAEYGQPVNDDLLRYLLAEVCEVSITSFDSDLKAKKDKEIARMQVTYNDKTVNISQ
jgi:hypothetical protein